MKPRILTFADPHLRKLIIEKEDGVKKGRKASSRIQIIENKIEESKKRQRKYTEECEPKELIEKGNALEAKINEEIEELAKIGEEIQKIKIAAIPKEELAKYEQLKKDLEAEERERNKIALRVQKIKDRFIPMLQRVVRPHLEKYEDIGSAELKGEKIVVQVFNDHENWIEEWEKKNGHKEPENLKTASE